MRIPLFLVLLSLGLNWPDLISSQETTTTVSNATALDERLLSNDTSEVDRDNDDSEPKVADPDDASHLTTINIEFGKNCDKVNPEACKHFPNVTCVTDSRRISICRCSFFRTWIPEDKICFLNVFSPCSKGAPGETDLACGENAYCANDTLGINKVKFCRCHRGFMPKLNEETIPAFCIPDPDVLPDVLDLAVDYEHGTAVRIHQSRLSIVLCSSLLLALATRN